MTRAEAFELMEQNIKNKNLRKHCIAVEVVMQDLAAHFGEDADKWGLAGLVHDIDIEVTNNDPEKHAVVGAQILRELGVCDEILTAILGHNSKAERTTVFDKALYASDPITGLIVAATLIHPDKELASIDAQFVLNRFGEKHFARGANREAIASCTEFGMQLEEFVALSLAAMKKISGPLGL